MQIDKVYDRGDYYCVFPLSWGGGSSVLKDSDEGIKVTAYLAEHPEALVDEPKPPEPTAEQKAQAIRSQRNALLAASDWTMLSDTVNANLAYATYRQALRDVTDQAGFPDSVIWPKKPE